MVGFCAALMYFHFAWPATLSSYHSAEWHLNAKQLALLAALGFLSFALMQIPGGYLTDLLGGRVTLTAALILLALGTAIFAGAATFSTAAFGRALIGLGAAVIFTGALKIFSYWFRAREYATILGAFILVGTMGSLAATLPLALAAERWGWRTPMIGIAVLTAIAVVVNWIIVRDDPTEIGLPSIDTLEPETAVPNAPASAAKPSLRIGFHTWRRTPTLWGTSLILFATTGTLWSFQALWAGPLLRHVRGLSVAAVGGALLMFTIGKGVGPALFGIISDRFVRARKPVVVFAVVGQTTLWLLVIGTFDRLPLPILYLAFAGLSVLHGGALLTQVMIKEITPPHLFGTVYGIINGAGWYGTAAIQLITGSVLNAIGPTTVTSEPVYSTQAYTLALCPIIVFMLIASSVSMKLDETLVPKEKIS